MIATGCIMARVCHTNNCPVGVASQREELRARFPGAPADLVRPVQSTCGLRQKPQFARELHAWFPGAHCIFGGAFDQALAQNVPTLCFRRLAGSAGLCPIFFELEHTHVRACAVLCIVAEESHMGQAALGFLGTHSRSQPQARGRHAQVNYFAFVAEEVRARLAALGFLETHSPSQPQARGRHAQVNYFAFVAEEVRAGLAALGLRSLDELVGRADLLRQRDLTLAKTAGLDLSYITAYAGPVQPSSERAANEVGPPLTSLLIRRHCWKC